MTLHNLKRQHLHYNETDENIKQLQHITNLDIERIIEIADENDRNHVFVEDVLQEDDGHYMINTYMDDYQRKTIVTVLGDNYQ